MAATAKYSQEPGDQKEIAANRLCLTEESFRCFEPGLKSSFEIWPRKHTILLSGSFGALGGKLNRREWEWS
jgi:hypothetical protein